MPDYPAPNSYTVDIQNPGSYKREFSSAKNNVGKSTSPCTYCNVRYTDSVLISKEFDTF